MAMHYGERIPAEDILHTFAQAHPHRLSLDLSDIILFPVSCYVIVNFYGLVFTKNFVHVHNPTKHKFPGSASALGH